MPIACLIFDFDGIIMESVNIKANAFAKLTAPYGAQAQDRMLMYNKIHGGVSRFIKFRWFFDEIIGREITDAELNDWGTRFEELCIEEVKNCPLVPGIQETLNKWYNKLPMYVCSGAPQAELEIVLKLRNLQHYFVKIYGFPPHKEKTLRQIMLDSKYQAEHMLMIGDSYTDLNAAEAVGTQFYGRGKDFMGGAWPWAEDLCGLNGWIEEQNSTSFSD